MGLYQRLKQTAAMIGLASSIAFGGCQFSQEEGSVAKKILPQELSLEATVGSFFLTEISKLSLDSGKPVFTFAELLSYWRLQGTSEYALQVLERLTPLQKQHHPGTQICRYWQLGVEAQDINHFNDTSKPNCFFQEPLELGDKAFENKAELDA